MRITKEELEASISPSKKEGSPIKSPTTPFSNKKTGVALYDESGQFQPTLIEDKIVAKSNVTESQSVYFIRVNRRGQVFNPNDSLYLQESIRTARQQGMATKPYRMVKCNKTAFESYLSFLKTKNSAFLRQAERGLL